MPRSSLQSRFSMIIGLTILAQCSWACSPLPFLAPSPTPSHTATNTPTDTATPSPTSTPTSTSTLTSTPSPTETLTSTVLLSPTGESTPEIPSFAGKDPVDWPVVFLDLFDNNDHGWDIGDVKTRSIELATSISGGKFHLYLKSMFPAPWAVYPALGTLEDFFASIDIRKQSGTRSADFGLVFREDGESHYYYRINPESRTYCVSIFHNGKWSDIIAWKQSKRILPYGVNQVAVLAARSRYIFFLNGEEVDQLDDSTLRLGRVGASITLHNSGDWIKIEADNLVVRAPEGSHATLTPMPG